MRAESAAPAVPPSRLESLGAAAVSAALARARRGTLAMRLPDGTRLRFGGAEPGRDASISVRAPAFFRRVLLGGDMGFGESYQAGEWDSPDPAAVVAFFIDNLEAVAAAGGILALASALRDRLSHRLRANTLEGSRRNIRAHYDLGDEFFRLFLDPSMTYSCALFAEGDDLEAAQRRKIARVLDKARVGPGDRVLEIGSGWGACAVEAAKRGASVVTLTLSERQHRAAAARAAAEGVAGRVEVRLEDFRRVEGRYDKIVSVEMIEALGHENFDAFFGACDRLLAPDGIMVLQGITIPDQRYDAYRRGCDWIQKHVFPGAQLPSLTALCESMTRASTLTVEAVENIGPHYARTLRLWSEALKSRRAEALALGFDEHLLRTWEYYFAYCEAGFATRTLGTLQLTLTRPGNRRLPGVTE